MPDFVKFFLEDGPYNRFEKSGSSRPFVLLHTIRNRLEYFDRATPFLTDLSPVTAITQVVKKLSFADYCAWVQRFKLKIIGGH